MGRWLTYFIAIAFPLSALFIACASDKGNDTQYLRFGEELDGTESKIYLVEAELSYGSYPMDIVWPPATAPPKKGDPAVIIRGSIGSDYEEDYYFALSAELYNSEGEKVGEVFTLDSAKPWFTQVHVGGGSIEEFELYVKYDKRDVARHELVLFSKPSNYPIP